ncbi:P-loop containing nucleoside triphosphate hydrolase protein [Pholiota molesta]|nr:P-loop containing nucleoside triphosphate hydrolase protein [Pholiota molesta]
MPQLPRHSKSKNADKPLPPQRGKSGWKGLKLGDLKGLAQKIKDKFKWKHTPREFQLQAIEAQLLRKDVLIHAGTGSGKMAIAAGPYAHEATEGMVTFLVLPLISLQEEQVITFEKEFGLTATALNSTHGGCSVEVMKSDEQQNICEGRWQIVIISPELMLTKRFISNVLRNPEMSRRLLSIVVDEAHVVSHWGSGFRKKYGSLGILRALVPKGTPMIAMSATLPARVRYDVLNKLQFNQKNYTYINMGNDRLNVSLIVRAMQHPMNTFRDLDFIIPKEVKTRDDINKIWIYVDSVSTGTDIAEYLYTLLPESFRNEGVVYNYNAVFSSTNRQQLMDLFRAGIVRVLICTDAAGMGCNIPDIDMIVQWKLPSSVSAFVQRAGRAARGPGRAGVAVLLVEPLVYQADLLQAHIIQNEEANKKGKVRRGIRENPNYPKAAEKGYAQTRGVLRGSHGAKFDTLAVDAATYEVPIDRDASDEGLYALVQTTICRRRILRLIYQNEVQDLSVPCCDLCNPELLDIVRAPAATPPTRKSALKIGVRYKPTARALVEWRKAIRKRDFKYALFPPSGILSDAAIDSLASVGPITSLIALEDALGGTWEWFGKYGNELLDKLTSLVIPPMQPKPAAFKKRTVEDDGNGAEDKGMGQTKRSRATAPSNPITLPTAVNLAPSQIQHVPQTPRTHAHSQAPIYSQNSSLARNPYSGYLHLGYSPYTSAYGFSSSPNIASSSSPSYYPFLWPQNPPPTPSQPPQPPRNFPSSGNPDFRPSSSS